MDSSDVLALRIQGEYREMPGLQLTLAQACRLWQVDQDQCEGVLEGLVREHVLRRTAHGGYVAVPLTGGDRARVTPASASWL